MLAIGNRILKIDSNRVGKGERFSAEEPLKCPVDELINGVQLVGKHDGEITELSMCQWLTTRLASASLDGTVCFFSFPPLIFLTGFRVIYVMFFLRWLLLYIRIETFLSSKWELVLVRLTNMFDNVTPTRMHGGHYSFTTAYL